MSEPSPFSEDERDCLQEVTNIAMGAAGESLALFAGEFVHLTIPVIRYITPADIPEALQSLAGQHKVSAVSQGYTAGDKQGFALIVITDPSFNDLAEFTHRQVTNDTVARQLLLDLTDTINGTCLPRLGEMLEVPLRLDRAEVISLHVGLNELDVKSIASWDKLVSIEINYHMDNHPFNCDLLLLMPDISVDKLKSILNRLLEDL